jgi:hypothetical protein
MTSKTNGSRRKAVRVALRPSDFLVIQLLADEDGQSVEDFIEARLVEVADFYRFRPEQTPSFRFEEMDDDIPF